MFCVSCFCFLMFRFCCFVVLLLFCCWIVFGVVLVLCLFFLFNRFFVFVVFCFYSFLFVFGGFKGQVRWPKGPHHLALNPPYLFCFLLFVLFGGVLFFFEGLRVRRGGPKGRLTWP